MMIWRVVCAALAVLAVGAFAFANTTEVAKGKVTAVSLNAVTVVAGDGQEWTFEAGPGTQVVAEGASHKSEELRSIGRKTAIGEFVRENQYVTVRYWEDNGRLTIEKLRVH
jgi:beta-lactam-binding protein with PASTA domain